MQSKNLRSAALAAMFFILFVAVAQYGRLLPGANAQGVVIIEDPKPEHVFMWRVKSPQGTAYLLGSVHLAKASLYPLDSRIEKAFASSQNLVVEINMNGPKMNAAASKMMAKGLYSQNDSLEINVSPATLQMAQTEAAKYGIDPANLSRFKPWLVSMMLSSLSLKALGIEAAHGLDQYFTTRAAGKKKILELETADSQLALFEGLTTADQESFLYYSLKDNQNTAREMNRLVSAWSSGDAKGMEALLLESGKASPAMGKMMKKIFDDRNKLMATKIRAMLKNKQTYFVLVGAGHMVGKNGLVSLLGKDFKVEQM